MTKNFIYRESYHVDDLLSIMQILRGEGGCPWDREQNHHTIRNNFIEETYEVIEAIDNEDRVLLREELGDVLLQVVFHSQMEQENGEFSFDDVCDGICKKLIYRHPHIFGDVIANSSEEVLSNWEELKKKEKQQKTSTSTLEAVSRALPALTRGQKVLKRAAKAGVGCCDIQSALDDLKCEIVKLEQVIADHNDSHISQELGELLFSTVNVSRVLKTDPEEALYHTIDSFIERFSIAESTGEAGVDRPEQESGQ